MNLDTMLRMFIRCVDDKLVELPGGGIMHNQADCPRISLSDLKYSVAMIRNLRRIEKRSALAFPNISIPIYGFLVRDSDSDIIVLDVRIMYMLHDFRPTYESNAPSKAVPLKSAVSMIMNEFKKCPAAAACLTTASGMYHWICHDTPYQMTHEARIVFEKEMAAMTDFSDYLVSVMDKGDILCIPEYGVITEE